MKVYRGISGPWKVSNDDDGLFINTDWEGEETQVEQFVTIWGDNASYVKTANLISAAPCLLNAMQEMLKDYDPKSIHEQHAYILAKNAVHKALGL